MKKFANTRSLLLCAAIALNGAGAAAQQTANAPATKQPASDESQKNGTGVVPPGVKLDPRMPGPGAPKPFHFPAAATKTLANGLRVYVVTDHREPAVAARLLILSAGSIDDPAGTPGVAQMTANLLTQGTKRRSAQDIADAIDFVGGTLQAQAGKDATTITVNVVKKDLNLGLDLMSDVVLHPAFQAEELDRQRQQLLSTLTVQYSNPEYLASLAFSHVVYGGSPYGWPSEGTPDTVKKLNRDELAKFHDQHYAPNQAFLAFAGDVTPEEAFALAEKYFGEWAKLDVPPSAAPAVPAPISGQHVWLIDKPDAVQTQIRVGKLGIRRADPDLIPLLVTNRIFGGGYNSRLNTEVRIKKGLTYGAFSSFTPRRFAGAFSAGTFTRTEATVEATKLVVDLLAKMAAGDIEPKELDFARDYLAGSYPLESETAEQVAERVLTAAAFELPADYNSTYPDRVRSVSLSQAKESAHRYFGTEDLDIVLAGNVGAFREGLKKEFPGAQFVEIPFDQLDATRADLRKPKQATPSATPESLARGKEILLAGAKAAGGEALSSVKGIGMTESGSMANSGSDAPYKVTWLVSYPDRSHGVAELQGQTINQVCDGKESWLQFPDRVVDASRFIGEFERGIELFGGGWGIYQRVLDGQLSGNFIGEEDIDGKKTDAVAVQAPFGPVKLYFDSATHLLAAARYKSESPRGVLDNEQRWSDFRTVEGKQFAYSTLIFRDGAKFVESNVQELKLNPGIDESLFVKPQASESK
ncbi:MAG: M16 family metallopeptidase [Candidatus Acidiferrales bacterium]